MTPEEIEKLVERFAETAGKAIKANAKYENVKPDAVAILTSSMLLAYFLFSKTST